MNRDLRDPELLGLAYLKLRRRNKKKKSSIEEAVNVDVPTLSLNPSCVEKYGTPDTVQPKFEVVQIV